MAFQIIDAVKRDTESWRQLFALPKVELHRHLEGSIRLSTLLEVNQQYKLQLPVANTAQLRPYVQMTAQDASDVDTFLTKFSILRQFFCAPEVIDRIVRESIEDAAADNIHYMELRFTPNALARAKSYSMEEVVRWVCHAANEAQVEHSILVRLIVSMNRHESLELAREALDAALKYRDQGVVAVDLAGKEPGFPARPFGALFREARHEGLGVTIHAGEWEGPENVKDAIENLRAQRIGHGIRIVEDSNALQYAKRHHVVFEVCPTSNLQTGVVGLVGHHPILDLHYLDMPITLNTDDPSICDTTLTDEYALAISGLRMKLPDIQTMIVNAAQATFLPDGERQALVDKLRGLME